MPGVLKSILKKPSSSTGKAVVAPKDAKVSFANEIAGFGLAPNPEWRGRQTYAKIISRGVFANPPPKPWPPRPHEKPGGVLWVTGSWSTSLSELYKICGTEPEKPVDPVLRKLQREPESPSELPMPRAPKSCLKKPSSPTGKAPESPSELPMPGVLKSCLKKPSSPTGKAVVAPKDAKVTFANEIVGFGLAPNPEWRGRQTYTKLISRNKALDRQPKPWPPRPCEKPGGVLWVTCSWSTSLS